MKMEKHTQKKRWMDFEDVKCQNMKTPHVSLPLHMKQKQI